MTFQFWKLKFLNSMTFQVSRDLCEPCKFEDKSKIKIRVYNIKCNLNQNGFLQKGESHISCLEKVKGTDHVILKSFPEGGNST